MRAYHFLLRAEIAHIPFFSHPPAHNFVMCPPLPSREAKKSLAGHPCDQLNILSLGKKKKKRTDKGAKWRLLPQALAISQA